MGLTGTALGSSQGGEVVEAGPGPIPKHTVPESLLARLIPAGVCRAPGAGALPSRVVSGLSEGPTTRPRSAVALRDEASLTPEPGPELAFSPPDQQGPESRLRGESGEAQLCPWRSRDRWPRVGGGDWAQGREESNHSAKLGEDVRNNKHIS